MNIEDRIDNFLVRYIKIGHISIYLEDDKYMIHVKVTKNNSVLSSEHRIFEADDDGNISKNMHGFLKKVYDECEFAYVSTFLDSINQNYIEGCGDSAITDKGFNVSNVSKICVDSKYTLFTPRPEIEKVQEHFKAIYGFDYIFPMFSVVDFVRSKIEGNEAVMYIVNSKFSANLTIYKNNELIYSTQFLFEVEKEEIQEEEDDLKLDEDQDFNLEEEGSSDDSLDDLDSLDFEEDDGIEEEGLGEMDDALEDLEEDSLDDFALEDDEVGLDEFEANESMGSESDMQKELLLFEFVDNSVNDYYKNPEHGGEFITDCFIYDSCKCSIGLKKHIKDIFLIDPKVLAMDLGEVLCDLSIEEARVE